MCLKNRQKGYSDLKRVPKVSTVSTLIPAQFGRPHHVDNVDHVLTNGPHCPQSVVYTVVYLHTVVRLVAASCMLQGRQLPAVDSPHSPQNLEGGGGGGGPSRWPNGSVALADNFYFYRRLQKIF